MALTIRIPSLRSLVLVFIGALLGATLVVPVAAVETTPKATTYTRTASCAGLSFYPANGEDKYDNLGPLRFHKGSTVGLIGSTGVYRCDPGLPSKAVVTRVQFTLKDLRPGILLPEIGVGFGVQGCALTRSGLTTASATVAEVMASVPSTGAGDPAAAPGDVRLGDSTIQSGSVDKARFGYWLECRILGNNELTGVYGATVTYRISSTNG